MGDRKADKNSAKQHVVFANGHFFSHLEYVLGGQTGLACCNSKLACCPDSKTKAPLTARSQTSAALEPISSIQTNQNESKHELKLNLVGS